MTKCQLIALCDPYNYNVTGSYLPNERKELFVTFGAFVSYWENKDQAKQRMDHQGQGFLL